MILLYKIGLKFLRILEYPYCYIITYISWTACLLIIIYSFIRDIPSETTSANLFIYSFFYYRAVTDPRDGRRVALKKLPNVFQSLVSSKRVFRELKMLCFFKHENVSVETHYQINALHTCLDWMHYQSESFGWIE